MAQPPVTLALVASKAQRRRATGRTTKQHVAVVFTLPDGTVLLQRRTIDAPTSPGLLGLFGGGVEPGEKPADAILREIGEETSLNAGQLALDFGGTVALPAGADYPHDRRIHVWRARLTSADFEVREGVRAEAYPPAAVPQLTDVTRTVVPALEALHLL